MRDFICRILFKHLVIFIHSKSGSIHDLLLYPLQFHAIRFIEFSFSSLAINDLYIPQTCPMPFFWKIPVGPVNYWIKTNTKQWNACLNGFTYFIADIFNPVGSVFLRMTRFSYYDRPFITVI